MELQKTELPKQLASLQQGTALAIISPTSLEKAYGAGGQISTLNREFEAQLDFGIIRLIKNLCDVYGANWSSNAQLITLDRLKKTYWHYGLDEFIYVLNDFEQKTYGALTPANVFEWFANYDKKRDLHSEKLALAHKEAFEKSERQDQIIEGKRIAKVLDSAYEKAYAQKRAKDLVDKEKFD